MQRVSVAEVQKASRGRVAEKRRKRNPKKPVTRARKPATMEQHDQRRGRATEDLAEDADDMINGRSLGE
jgi:hypothetical protein